MMTVFNMLDTPIVKKGKGKEGSRAIPASCVVGSLARRPLLLLLHHEFVCEGQSSGLVVRAHPCGRECVRVCMVEHLCGVPQHLVVLPLGKNGLFRFVFLVFSLFLASFDYVSYWQNTLSINYNTILYEAKNHASSINLDIQNTQ